MSSIEASKRFYENEIAPMIHEQYPDYEHRIAVGIAGEGSDCFGYDDLISRDHDFGTGVCLWLTDEDYQKIGKELTYAYDKMAYDRLGANLTDRLKERRGVMTIHDFYSNILYIDCDTDGCTMSYEKWNSLDHACLATAVNGEVFRDDLGAFSAFRKLLLDYYPDDIWKLRIANGLHDFSAALQVNYARCMTRKDYVAAELCRLRGLETAMELFFLLKRKYPPYYKWTYRALDELDDRNTFSGLIADLANTKSDLSSWEEKVYKPDEINLDDPVIVITEKIAGEILTLLRKNRFTRGEDPYLERYVDDVLF